MTSLTFSTGDVHFLGQRLDVLFGGGQELMQRRIQITDGHRAAFQRLVHALKVALLIRQQLGKSRGAVLHVGLGEGIISRMSAIRSPRRTCARCGRPMPSAPNFTACAASRGLSALVRTLSLRAASAQPIRVAKSPETWRQRSGIASAYTLPVEPSMLIQSPSWKPTSPMVAVLGFLIHAQTAAGDATGAHAAGTTAAWEVMPPRAVRMPWACAMPSMSSGGGLQKRTRTTFCRSWRRGRLFSGEVHHAAGSARSGQAPWRSPSPSSATASNCGCSRESSCFGSTLRGWPLRW